ncbi:MAG: hypothetical protein AAGA55_06590 [Planctomycetota bacterium]
MTFRVCMVVLAIAALHGRLCRADSAHPQDGPHADLRVVIEDRLVRFSAGVNLAFLDEAVDVPREAAGELSPAEGEQLLAAFRAMLASDAPCVINGEPIEPVFEHLELFADPEPGMVAVFPRMGNRALIRASAVVRFDAPAMVDAVEITWPAYPIDQLAGGPAGPDAAQARMYFEAVFTARGRSLPARFTHAEPTIRWSVDDAAAADAPDALPPPSISGDRLSHVGYRFLLGGAVLAAVGTGIVARSNTVRAGSLTAVLVLFAFWFVMPKRSPAEPIVTDSEAQRILLSIHKSMYRAFDYTAESDIYDRLDRAIGGELLGDLYEQIRLSLLQAEEEMKIGVVTALEPIETNIEGIDAAGTTPSGLGFSATHRWRVDGTVYHWGHSHTRTHLYEARYRVSYTNNGWRITDHNLLSQRRIDPVGDTPSELTDPNLRALDRLGHPDI